MKKGLLFLLASLCFVVVSCRKGSFELSGTIADAAGQTVYLEREGVASVEPVDSATISKSGDFRFRQPAPAEPSFYRLRWKNQVIHLGIDSLEQIILTADTVNFATGYTVEGSPVCADMKAILLKQQETARLLKQLKEEYNAGTLSDALYQEKALAVIGEIKDFLTRYIRRSPQSLTAYYALFQQVDGALVFGLYNKADFQLYALVTNVLKLYYPESKRTANLEKLALQGLIEVKGLATLAEDSIRSRITEETGIVEIALPNIAGEIVSLSDYAKNSVVLLDFIAYETSVSPEHNMWLGELYEAYSGKGLKIYQVSVDKDEHLWKNRASNLPWMCVWAGEEAQRTLMAYNVGGLPTAFVIDRTGVLAARIENNRDLKQALERYF